MLATFLNPIESEFGLMNAYFDFNREEIQATLVRSRLYGIMPARNLLKMGNWTRNKRVILCRQVETKLELTGKQVVIGDLLVRDMYLAH